MSPRWAFFRACRSPIGIPLLASEVPVARGFGAQLRSQFESLGSLSCLVCATAGSASASRFGSSQPLDPNGNFASKADARPTGLPEVGYGRSTNR